MTKFDRESVQFLKKAYSSPYEGSGDGELSKRGLWRDGSSYTDDRYSLIDTTGVFMGMIEKGEFVANGAAIKIKLIIRGFARVPAWWFNRTDFYNRNHYFMGPFFTHNHSQRKLFKNAPVTRERTWLALADERSKTENSLIDCFFNL